ncbi:uncharacterized protein GGS22DRAFT_155137 [Annulohypoxylon maeteangense]|uniref:uncharacterized protein n=1 Tax=Annulohypoxylon maeteangense TaxID=1927788 RepID=UPI0020082070|nr:uncharacterized protein GGS22DRAFT_155137 [Annulohypoxylon maeteangense]KAI0888132.1 hypothetical protein GGS22DRAFT_155137 [Annulohypoxylon maeteangense]
MWKRIRSRKQSGSDISSNSTSNPTSSTDRPRYNSLPEPTLSLPERTRAQRRESDQSAISDIHAQLFSLPTSAEHRRQRSRDRRNDPLGLFVLHAPVQRSVDILFIHGLGGTSLRSWCRNRDLENLWPQLWLPEEPDLTSARILSFGYNAHFSSKKEQASLTIGDFANDLLFRMKYGENGPERLGQVPLIVVAHSMGGLVFKKAFIHGHMNEEFRGIISSIKAVLFLATPHRGTDLAETLNKILTSSFFGHSSKDYVSELARRSPTIDELNESFRHHASKLQIFSFYETLSTNVGLMSFMILEKQSSVLGYPNETPQPLTANHHDVCKFKDRNDPNYISVVGALRGVIATINSDQNPDDNIEEDLTHVAALLGISSPPEDDITACRAVRKAGTCQKLLYSEEFDSWKEADSSHVLWVHAPPGSGKSTICSTVVDYLLEEGHNCAYFFFKHGNRQKRSLSNMLRSLAYQSALMIPSYRRALADLAKSGQQFHASDALTVWKRLYVSILSHLKFEGLYWILDAIDESESTKQVVEFISMTGDFESQVRILVFSRPLPIINQSFQMAKRRTHIVTMALPRNEDDIRLLVAEEIEYLPSDDGFKIETTDEIIRRSQGNFLWVSLVLKRVIRCHRQEQVKRVLDETPDGMDELYDRMLSAVVGLDLKEDKILARILLSWAMYAKTSLTIDELSEPYANEFGSVMDLKHTISQICGQFVIVDAHNRISLVHHSAHQYLKRSGQSRLQSFSLDSETVHEELLCKCLQTLCDRTLRNKINTLKIPQFLPYAATSWAFHLESCSAESDRVLDTLVRFFGGPFPFPWIQYLSMSNHLAELTTVSRRLTSFTRRRRKVENDRSPMLHRLSDLSSIDNWAVDLLKLPAKFGRHLTEDPQLIYKCIPALSPISSAIFQKFSGSPTTTLSVSGLSNVEWDDCLARVSANTGKALRLAVTSLYLAVASDMPMGNITLWDTNLFVEFATFDVGEYIHSLAFDDSGSLLACYGLSHTYVWKLGTSSLIRTVRNPVRERALEFKFSGSDSLMMITDLRRVYYLSISDDIDTSVGWTRLSATLMEETNIPEGMFLGSPSSVSFNNNFTQIAVSYRAFPLTIWNINPPEIVARLKLKPKQGQGAINSHTGTNKVVWHPSGTQVVGIYGQVFRWSPVDDTYDEAKGDSGIIPNEIQCSPNGLVFITSDVEGTIKIYDFAQMTVIYKLTSEDQINMICFSPGSIRFYDLRGSYCNIWEPNCLLRLADAVHERISDSDSVSESIWSDTEDTRSTSISLPTSESHADSKPAITTVAASTRADQYIAYGNDDGVIEIFDPTSNSRHIVAQTLFGIGIESLAWNRSHDQLAFSLLDGTITIKEISGRTAGKRQVSVKDLYVEKTPPAKRGRVQQLLFDPAGKLLFVHGASKSQVLVLPTGEVAAEHDTPEDESSQWIQHPSRQDALISVNTRSLSIFTWKLEEDHTVPLEIMSSLPNSFTIDALYQCHYPRFFLLRTSNLHLNKLQHGFILLPITNLGAGHNRDETQASIKPVDLPETITQAVSHPLGVLPDGRMVFLDNNLWVCTTQLSSATKTITRHFFIPHDWVTDSGLRLCQLLRDGTLLCPSKGEVAIIQNDMVSEW